MRNTKDLRILKTERAIHEAFFSLMKKNGFEKISVKDISDAAMISRNTFYLHYSDKYDLLESVCKSMIDKLLEKVFNEVLKIGDFTMDYNINSLTSVFMVANDVISEDLENYRILIENNCAQVFLNKLAETFYESLKYIQSDIEGLSEYSLHYITGGLVYAMVYKIKSGDTENNHNIAEAFVRMHFGTLTEFIKTYKKKKVELAP